MGNMKSDSLLEFCRYYKGEKQSPFEDYTKKTLWSIEELWVSKMSITDDKFLTRCLDDYLDNDLSNFEIFDDVPVSLKAVLFNRLMQYDERIDVDAFKKFYLQYYK